MTRCILEDTYTEPPEQNAGVILDVFSGKNQGPCREAVIINARGALYIGDKAGSFA